MIAFNESFYIILLQHGAIKDGKQSLAVTCEFGANKW